MINELIEHAGWQCANGQYEDALAKLSEAIDLKNYDGSLRDAYLLYSKVLFLLERRTDAETVLKWLAMSEPAENLYKEALLEFYNDSGEVKKGAELAMALINSISLLSDEKLFICLDLLEMNGAYREASIFSEKLIAAGAGGEELNERHHKLLKLSRGHEFKNAQFQYDENGVNEFYRLFSGRENVFAKQVKLQNGEYGYHPVYEKMRPEHVKMHFDGDITLGSYTVTLDNSCYYMAIDLDIRKAYQYKLEKTGRQALLGKMKESLRKIKTISEFFGLKPVFEFSGNKGFHVWYFFIEPISCKIARRIGYYIIYKLGVLPLEFLFEIFPKQDEVKHGGIGNLIKLPLGIHLKTNTRGVFVDEANFDVAGDQFDYLKSIKRHTRDEIDMVLGRIAEDNRNNINKNARSKGVDSGDYSVLKSKNAGAAGGENADGEGKSTLAPEKEFKTLAISIPYPQKLPEMIQNMLSRCKILWSIVRKANEQHILNHIEKHVLIYSLTPLGEAGQLFVHQTLSKCADYDPEKVGRDLRAVPPNPISCPKIRKSMKDLAELVGCRCIFELPPKTYPSPLIYANIFPHSEEKLKNAADRSYQDQKLIASSYKPDDMDIMMFKFESIKSEIKKQEELMAEIKDSMARLFKAGNFNQIESQTAKYEIIYEAGGEFEIIKKEKE